MSDKKTTWDDVPTIDGLEVEWEYEPDTPLGRRTRIRLLREDLQGLLGKKHVAVKIMAKTREYNASLMDISQGGLAVFNDDALQVETPVRFGLILGSQKIISKALVRNVNKHENGFRIGLEFAEVDFETENYIAGLVAANVYKQG